MLMVNRRQWAGSMLASALLETTGRPRTYAVVGAGVFGAWTAYHLLSRGNQIILLDAYGPASSRASSGGETRIIRCAYGPDEVYTRMAKRSLMLWSDFFESTHRHLLRRVGVLWMAKPDNAYAQQSRKTLRDAGVPFRDLSAADLARLYPQIRVAPETTAILEPESGALMARQAVAAVVEKFVARGGVYRQAAIAAPQGKGAVNAIRTMSGETITADGFVFACGPWLGKVFPALLGNRIFPTRQEVLFFGIPAGQCPYGLISATIAACMAFRTWIHAASRSLLISTGRLLTRTPANVLCGLKKSPKRAGMSRSVFPPWRTRRLSIRECASTKIPRMATSSLIAIPTLKMSGYWAAVQATASSTDPLSENTQRPASRGPLLRRLSRVSRLPPKARNRTALFIDCVDALRSNLRDRASR